MNKKKWFAIFFLVIAIALVVYILLVEVKKPTTEEAKEEKKVVLRVKPDEVMNIEFYNSSGEEIICTRKAKEDWNIIKPVQDKADSGIVASLLSQMEKLKAENQLEGGNIKDYGLDEPKARLRLELTDKEKIELLIGIKTFDDSAYYCKLANKNEIFTLEKYIVDNYIDKKLDELRNKKLVVFDKDKVYKLIIKQGKTEAICEKQDKDNWQLVSPYKARADKDIINMWLINFHNLRIDEFVEEKPVSLERFGLLPPQAVFELYIEGREKPEVLFIGKKSGEKYYAKLKTRNNVVSLDSSSIDDLLKKPRDLQDLYLFSFRDFENIISISVEKGNKKFKAVKIDKDWQVLEPTKGKGIVWKIENPIRGLLWSKYQEEFIPKPKELSKLGLLPPVITVTLEDKQKKEYKIFIGDKLPKKIEREPLPSRYGKSPKVEGVVAYYAQKKGEKKVWALTESVFKDIEGIINEVPIEKEEEGKK